MCEAFGRLVELALATGATSIKDLPGCWEHDVDGRWWVAVNAHGEPVKCSHGVEVEPFRAYVEFDGWPAGVLTPDGGEFAAGSEANEDTFIAALVAATEKQGGDGT